MREPVLHPKKLDSLCRWILLVADGNRVRLEACSRVSLVIRSCSDEADPSRGRLLAHNRTLGSGPSQLDWHGADCQLGAG